MKRAFQRSLVLGLAVALVLGATAWADTLELKGGRILRGRYLGGTQNTVRFEVSGQVETFAIADVLAITFSASAATSQPVAPAPAPRSAHPVSDRVTVPAGTRLLVRMIDSVDSETNKVGDRFRASLQEDLVVEGKVVARKEADVYGRLVEAKESGKLTGRAELTLELTEIMIGGELQRISSGEYGLSGDSRGRDTAKKVGGGALIGAVIGAIAGGGKGAAIGAGVGAGAGTAVQVLTKGERIRVPSETLLEFQIEEAFTVRVPAAAH